jgi:uncharacterized repeat protein (TIGR03803 family)
MKANHKEITAESPHWAHWLIQPRSGRGNEALINFCFLLSALCFFTAAQAQTATTIKSFGAFTNITGFSPQSTLVQGPDGTLYGTASDGEGSVAGTIFKVQPDGTGFTVLK